MEKEELEQINNQVIYSNNEVVFNTNPVILENQLSNNIETQVIKENNNIYEENTQITELPIIENSQIIEPSNTENQVAKS
jgi:hypothetical protein